MTHHSHRGFTLLVAIILSSVALALSLALLDVAYKQISLALTTKQSSYAFYNADAALECALYFDQKRDAFNYTTPLPLSSVVCGGLQATVAPPLTPPSGAHSTSFYIPCASGGTAALVTVIKYSTAQAKFYADGYNTCDTSDTRRIERGLRASY